MKDKLQLELKGRVKLIIFDRGGIKREIDQHNAIQALALDIAARRLIQDPQSLIDTISLYNGATLLATKTIQTYNYPALQEVSFEATFGPADFAGAFTKGQLSASALGAFSILDGLAGTKSNTESLLVTWIIQIVNCA